MPLKKIKTITGHAAYFRFNCELSDEPVGYIPRQADIPSPYSYSPVHPVWLWSKPNKNPFTFGEDFRVICVETRHSRHEIFEVPAEMIKATEEEIISIPVYTETQEKI